LGTLDEWSLEVGLSFCRRMPPMYRGSVGRSVCLLTGRTLGRVKETGGACVLVNCQEHLSYYRVWSSSAWTNADTLGSAAVLRERLLYAGQSASRRSRWPRSRCLTPHGARSISVGARRFGTTALEHGQGPRSRVAARLCRLIALYSRHRVFQNYERLAPTRMRRQQAPGLITGLRVQRT